MNRFEAVHRLELLRGLASRHGYVRGPRLARAVHFDVTGGRAMLDPDPYEPTAGPDSRVQILFVNQDQSRRTDTTDGSDDEVLKLLNVTAVTRDRNI
jgi:hypothetical protein